MKSTSPYWANTRRPISVLRATATAARLSLIRRRWSGPLQARYWPRTRERRWGARGLTYRAMWARIHGFARAFFYAGAHALLVSHWAVDSDAATRLTTATFDILKNDPKLGRAEALRRAMLAYYSGSSWARWWVVASHDLVFAPFAPGHDTGSHRPAGPGAGKQTLNIIRFGLPSSCPDARAEIPLHRLLLRSHHGRSYGEGPCPARPPP
jgi:CHAT domain